MLSSTVLVGLISSMLQQSHSNKVLIRIDGIETFLDHPNHDFLISSLRKVVSQKPEKINTVEELCGSSFSFFPAIMCIPPFIF